MLVVTAKLLNQTQTLACLTVTHAYTDSFGLLEEHRRLSGTGESCWTLVISRFVGFVICFQNRHSTEIEWGSL